LKNLADSYSLVYSIPALSVSTHYLDIQGHAHIVIDLIFLCMSCAQVFYCIKPDLRWFSDHAPLIVDLPITLKNICIYKMVFKHKSEEKVILLLFVSEELSQLDFYTLNSIVGLNLLSKAILELFANC